MNIHDVQVDQEVEWTDPDGGNKIRGVVWNIKGEPEEREEDTEIEVLTSAGYNLPVTFGALAGELELINRGET